MSKATADTYIRSIDRAICAASFSICLLLEQERKTKPVRGSLEPQWKEVFEFDLDEPNHLTSQDLLEVRLYDHERIGKPR